MPRHDLARAGVVHVDGAALALFTGLRRGELFALRWKDLDLAERTLTVRESVYEGVFDTPKTEAGCRRMPLSAGAVQLVESWRRRVASTDGEALVFSTWSGKPISPNKVLKRIQWRRTCSDSPECRG